MDEKKIIPSGTYEGYIWMSDQNYIDKNTDVPLVIKGEYPGRELVDGENPFVIEAQLYDRQNKKSISIKYNDGHYLVNTFDVTEEDLADGDIREYQSNRMGGKTLRFCQRWRAFPNDDCEGMEVLTPVEIVFIGFSK